MGIFSMLWQVVTLLSKSTLASFVFSMSKTTFEHAFNVKFPAWITSFSGTPSFSLSFFPHLQRWAHLHWVSMELHIQSLFNDRSIKIPTVNYFFFNSIHIQFAFHIQHWKWTLWFSAALSSLLASFFFQRFIFVKCHIQGGKRTACSVICAWTE